MLLPWLTSSPTSLKSNFWRSSLRGSISKYKHNGFIIYSNGLRLLWYVWMNIPREHISLSVSACTMLNQRRRVLRMHYLQWKMCIEYQTTFVWLIPGGSGALISHICDYSNNTRDGFQRVDWFRLRAFKVAGWTFVDPKELFEGLGPSSSLSETVVSLSHIFVFHKGNHVHFNNIYRCL